METLLGKSQLDTYIRNLDDDKLNGDFNEIFKSAPLPKSAACGFGSLRGRFMQKFANKKCFIFIFGVVGLIFASSHAYYNGTISTMEKRFKIPSKNMGMIATGNDITGFFLSTFIAYYGGRGHRPRWMAMGVIAMVIYCLLNSAPHFMYGPGDDALALTEEYGGVKDEQQSKALQEMNNQKLICQTNSTSATKCKEDEGNMGAQLYLFAANLIAGVGQSLKHSLGLSYLDDNIKKSKTPALISLSYFIRLLGPATGYALASFSLNIYIAPELTPVITNKDPRWLGAWYMGWILIAGALLGFSVLMFLFPKELPRAAVRRRVAAEKERRLLVVNPDAKIEIKQEEEASLRDFAATFKRLITNKIYLYNTLSTIFTIFGFMPFWIFSPKLIESLYRQSASASSMFTGSFALLSSAAGLLSAGFVITKYKPRARYLTLWNVIIGVFSVLSILSFSLLGCDESRNAVKINYDDFPSCNSQCNCDFVKYAPVCGVDGITYISGCHAGCTAITSRNATKSFSECSCIEAVVHHEFKQTAKSGPCPINCNRQLTYFLIIMCFMKFIGATGRAGNFLIGMRCVEERDKTVAIGFGMSVVRILAAVPSPIFFGYILDSACIAWGKTCTSKGNCWLYDGESLKYWFFYASAAAVAVGTLFDYFVYRGAMHLKIFDDKDTPVEDGGKEPKK